MTTLAQTVTTVQFDNALRQMAERARTRYAGEAARIDRGLVMALNGGVTLHQDGTASVQSSSNAEVVYTVNGHCDCPDASRAPEGRCKHRWAKCLVKRAQQQVAEDKAQHTYYATYYAEHATYQGTAQYLDGQGWVFRSDEDDFTLAYADCGSLALGGNVALLEAQRVADETTPGHVARICGYAN
jgi:hypothetical protein